MKAVDDIAAEFGFEVEALERALLDALEFHDLASGTTDHQQALQQFADKLRLVQQSWEALPRVARILMSYDGPSLNSAEPVMHEPIIHDVAGRVAHLHGLAVRRAGEIKEFRERSLGKGRKLQLAGLLAFADEVKVFWLANKKDRFGCNFTGTGKDTKPNNDASRFLWACVQWLGRGYSATNVNSCMRRLNEGESPVWNHDQDTLTDEQIADFKRKVRIGIAESKRK